MDKQPKIPSRDSRGQDAPGRLFPDGDCLESLILTYAGVLACRWGGNDSTCEEYPYMSKESR